MTSSSIEVGALAQLSAAERLATVDWNFTGPGSRLRVHDLHPYPARFIPEIPRALIRLFPPPPETTVLDPFCGCGTTLVEAGLAGLPAVGIDLHPLATLISKVKTTPLDESLVLSGQMVLAAARSGGPQPIPSIPRLDHWFKPEVQDALARLVSAIDRVGNANSRDALRVAFSRIVVRVSNQDSDTRYAAVNKNVTTVDVYMEFARSVEMVGRALDEAYSPLRSERPDVTVITQNVLQVQPAALKLAGLVVTSPPYPNAYEYWLYHKYRMYWLGMDPLAVRASEIGARPHYFKKNHQTAADFESQMGQCFVLLSQVLHPDGVICFLVGRSVIHGEEIDNAALLTRAAREAGLRRVAQVTRQIPSHRKSFNLSHASIQEEGLLVFGK